MYDLLFQEKNLHFDIDLDIHMSSKHYENNGIGNNSSLVIVLH